MQNRLSIVNISDFPESGNIASAFFEVHLKIQQLYRPLATRPYKRMIRLPKLIQKSRRACFLTLGVYMACKSAMYTVSPKYATEFSLQRHQISTNFQSYFTVTPSRNLLYTD